MGRNQIGQCPPCSRDNHRPAVRRDLSVDGASNAVSSAKKPADPDEYYLTGVICLALSVGLPILGYFIGQIAAEAFFPIAGAGVLLAILGVTFLLWARFLTHRAKNARDEN